MNRKSAYSRCLSLTHQRLLRRCACLLLAVGFAASEFALALGVTDFAGRRVELAKPAERIVALAPHSVENLFSAGAGHKLVGVVSYSNFPAAAKRLPIVGSYNAFSFEQIVALKPDLVVMWGSGNGMQTLAQLERLGIPVYVSELRRLADVPASIRKLGVLAGTEVVSDQKAVELEAALRGLQRTYSDEATLSVFYQIWNEPLQTVNGEHLISEIITLCGGRNIFADSPALAPRISVEAVLLANPDAIVASGMGVARPQWLDDWRRYPTLAAVRSDGLLFIDPDHLQRPTARVFAGARELCEQMATLRRAHPAHQAAGRTSATPDPDGT